MTADRARVVEGAASQDRQKPSTSGTYTNVLSVHCTDEILINWKFRSNHAITTSDQSLTRDEPPNNEMSHVQLKNNNSFFLMKMLNCFIVVIFAY